MTARVTAIAAAVLLLSAFSAHPQVIIPPRDLSFEQRVEAQRAIQRVYHGHLVGSQLPFEEGVSREVLEGKVRTYLKQSAALERFWGTPVTDAMLQAEMARIARDTRLPERLIEIYHALGDDPFVIKETFVRAALVDRLARGFFPTDQRVLAEALHS